MSFAEMIFLNVPKKPNQESGTLGFLSKLGGGGGIGQEGVAWTSCAKRFVDADEKGKRVRGVRSSIIPIHHFHYSGFYVAAEKPMTREAVEIIVL